MAEHAVPISSSSDMSLNRGAGAPEVSWNIDPTEWVDDHGDYLFRYAIVRLRDEARAEDAVQETLLAALQNLGSYRGKASERTWLTSILNHKIVDQIRKACREVQFEPSDCDLSEFDPLFDRPDRFKDHWSDTLSPRIWNRSPEEALTQEEFFAVLQECLSKLPERVSKVFGLREVVELDAKEICSILGLSESNFWVIMHRARMGLRRCIELNWFMRSK